VISMIRPQSSPGFTLLELMIATSLGLAVVLVAALGYRAAAAAMSGAQRLSRENVAIGAGLSSAFDELDQWHFYDDPSAPSGDPRQTLRNTCLIPSTDPVEYIPPSPGSPSNSYPANAQYQMGLPFTRFRDTWGTAAIGSQQFGITITNGGQTGWLVDDKEEERTWAISASNPLTSWASSLSSSYGRQSVMRRGYLSIGGLSTLSGAATIGGGIYSLNYRDVASENNLQFQRYGTIPFVYPLNNDPYMDMFNNRNSQAGGWLYNQMRGLDLSLGYYGLLDYVPAGIPPCYPINGTVLTSLQKAAHYPNNVDAEGFPIFSTYGYYWVGSNTYDVANGGGSHPLTGLTPASGNPTASWDYIATNYRFFNYVWPRNHHSTFPVIPSRNSLLNPGGFSVIPWCTKWDQQGISVLGAPTPLSGGAAAVKNAVFFNRSYMITGEDGDSNFQLNQSGKSSYFYEPSLAGPLVGYASDPTTTGTYVRLGLVIGTVPESPVGNDNLYFTKYLHRITGEMRLLPVRPADWPDINVSVLHQVRQNRFTNLSNVSWFDPVTAQKYDLRFTAMGTTLRGARRQRSLDQ